jgi:hypothetical protein
MAPGVLQEAQVVLAGPEVVAAIVPQPVELAQQDRATAGAQELTRRQSLPQATEVAPDWPRRAPQQASVFHRPSQEAQSFTLAAVEVESVPARYRQEPTEAVVQVEVPQCPRQRGRRILAAAVAASIRQAQQALAAPAS